MLSVTTYSQSMNEWPEIEFPDIVNYLLFSTSKFTKKELKAYKSLQSYQYFVAGWVRSIFVGKATEDTTILIGKVRKTFCIHCMTSLKILNCFDKFFTSSPLCFLTFLCCLF